MARGGQRASFAPSTESAGGPHDLQGHGRQARGACSMMSQRLVWQDATRWSGRAWLLGKPNGPNSRVRSVRRTGWSRRSVRENGPVWPGRWSSRRPGSALRSQRFQVLSSGLLEGVPYRRPNSLIRPDPLLRSRRHPVRSAACAADPEAAVAGPDSRQPAGAVRSPDGRPGWRPSVRVPRESA